jgi:cholesterol oxidase
VAPTGAWTGKSNYSVDYLDGYGHLDAIIGRNAARDVFPHILEQLEAHARHSTQ